jgi:hypothetical protein
MSIMDATYSAGIPDATQSAALKPNRTSSSGAAREDESMAISVKRVA